MPGSRAMWPEALVAGHGFGSPFVSNQPSAIMPPVYPLIVAGFFRSSAFTRATSILAIHIFDCVDQCARLHSDFSARAAKLWRAGGCVGGLGMGLFPVRHLLFGGVGLVNASASALPVLVALPRAGHGESRAPWSVGRLWPARRICWRSPSHRRLWWFRSCWRWPAWDWRTTASAGWCRASWPR